MDRLIVGNALSRSNEPAGCARMLRIHAWATLVARDFLARRPARGCVRRASVDLAPVPLRGDLVGSPVAAISAQSPG